MLTITLAVEGQMPHAWITARRVMDEPPMTVERHGCSTRSLLTYDYRLMVHVPEPRSAVPVITVKEGRVLHDPLLDSFHLVAAVLQDTGHMP